MLALRAWPELTCDRDNVGMYHFAAVQATPSFSNSFPQIFGERDDIPCLIPCAIDQDPYVRVQFCSTSFARFLPQLPSHPLCDTTLTRQFLFTRDAADKLGYKKPALLHTKFLPALQGANTKMSASNENSAIFMTDEPKKIAKKIKSHAFSGGGATQEDHQKYGGNPDVDVAYQYLSFFEDDDDKMESLAREYRAGTLSTSQMKEACIAKLQQVVGEFQKVSRAAEIKIGCKGVASCTSADVESAPIRSDGRDGQIVPGPNAEDRSLGRAQVMSASVPQT